MRKILFISDSVGSDMSANFACEYEIAKIFYKNGYEVHVMGFKGYNEKAEEIWDGINIHRVLPNLYNKVRIYSIKHSKEFKGKLASWFMKLLGIRVIFLLPFFPVRAPFFILKYMREAEKLHKRFEFAMVISSYNPLEALYAGDHLKKKFNVNFCSYFLDTLTDNIPKHHFLSKKFMDNQGYKYEKKFFQSSDLILNLKCHEQNFLNAKYDLYRNKMKIVDIPHLKNRINHKNKANNCNKIKIVYTGSIRDNLLPYILEIFKNINNTELHFYGTNNIVLPDSDYIIKHGSVSREISLEAQFNSDILMSMGNKDSAFIPSKIFEYMSTGKKIIHFCFDNSDSTIPYYKKYPDVVIININDNIQENLNKVQKFIDEPASLISYGDLINIFPECDAEYTYNTITDFFNL